MNKGAILFSPNHEFVDAKSADKFLILLNNPTLTSSYVLVFVNSKSPWRSKLSGCHKEVADAYFVIDKKRDWFNADKTFVIFRNVEVYCERQINEQQTKGNLKPVATLKKDMLKEIVDCYKRSAFISGHIKELLETF